MSFKKGQIITYSFPERQTENGLKSKIIQDFHRAVVLHKRETPFKTILIAPITKAGSLRNKGSIPSNYLELKKEYYPFVLEEDSYVNLDMTMPVDEEEIGDYEKGVFKVEAKLEDFDLYQLDYKITLTYELNKFIKTELALELNREFENVLTFIDEEIKARIGEVLQSIDEPEALNKVVNLIDLLMEQIKEGYIKPNFKKGEYIEEEK